MLSQEKFGELVKKHQKDAYKFALSLCKNPTDAEDFVQEAFVHAYEHIDSYDETKPFIPWLFTIIRHRFLDKIRKEANSPTTAENEFTGHWRGSPSQLSSAFDRDTEDWHPPFDGEDTTLDVEQAAINAELRKNIERLKGRRYEIMSRVLDGYSTTEIAAELAVSKRTVEREIKSAAMKLKMFVAKVD